MLSFVPSFRDRSSSLLPPLSTVPPASSFASYLISPISSTSSGSLKSSSGNHRGVLSRHRWKFIGGATLLGVVGYNVYLVFLELQNIRHFIQQAAGLVDSEEEQEEDDDQDSDTEHVRLTKKRGKPDNKNQQRSIGWSGLNRKEEEKLLVQFGIANSDEWKMSLHFHRNQNISDITAARHIERLRPELLSQYKLEYFTNQLRDNSDGLTLAEREAYFNQMKLLTFGRYFYSMFFVLLILLAFRFQINFIGKNMFHAAVGRGGRKENHDREDTAEELNYAYLSAGYFMLMSEASRDHLRSIVDANVVEHFDTVPPGAVLTLDDLHELMRAVVAGIACDLFKEGGIVAIVLPDQPSLEPAESIEGKVGLYKDIFDGEWLSEAGLQTVNWWLDYTRDYVESFPFRAVFVDAADVFLSQSLELVAAKVLPEVSWKPKNEACEPGFRTYLQGKADSSKGEFLLARTMGRMCKISEGLLMTKGDVHQAFVKRFGSSQIVKTFCEDVYFADVFLQLDADIRGQAEDSGKRVVAQTEKARAERQAIQEIYNIKGVRELIDQMDFGIGQDVLDDTDSSNTSS